MDPTGAKLMRMSATRNLLVLAAAAVLAVPAAAGSGCGLRGSLDSRLADCAKPSSNGGLGTSAKRELIVLDANDTNNPLGGLDKPSQIWRVAAKTSSGAMVWLDVTTGLLWCDGQDGKNPCPDTRQAKSDCGEMPVSFRRPTADELKTAKQHKVDTLLPATGRVCVATGTKPKPQKAPAGLGF